MARVVWINPFWSSFLRLWGTFSLPFFDAFLEGVFFGLWATFGCPRCPKGLQNGAKMEAKASLEAPSGKCKNHGRGCVFSILGGSGRVREATFSRLGLQTLFGGVLGCIFSDFWRFWVSFGVSLGSLLGKKGIQK